MSALMQESMLMEARRGRMGVVYLLTGDGPDIMGPDLGAPVAPVQLHSSLAARRRGRLDLESNKGGEVKGNWDILCILCL